MSNLLLIDSREKPKAIGKILDYLIRNGIDYEVSKLFVGDYMFYDNPGIIVDRKQNIAELAKNCTSDHERFRRELERTKKAGARLVVLVEQNRYKDRDEWIEVETVSDLLRWSSPHTVVRGEKVFRVLSSWMAKYPISVVFCDKRSTGRKIVEILREERK